MPVQYVDARRTLHLWLGGIFEFRAVRGLARARLVGGIPGSTQVGVFSNVQIYETNQRQY